MDIELPPDPLMTVTAALQTLVAYVDNLETRVRYLQVTTAAIAGEHLRDEDVRLEVLRVGDLVRVDASRVLEWQQAGAGLCVLVCQIHAEPDGTKTVMIVPEEIGRRRAEADP